MPAKMNCPLVEALSAAVIAWRLFLASDFSTSAPLSPSRTLISVARNCSAVSRMPSSAFCVTSRREETRPLVSMMPFSRLYWSRRPIVLPVLPPSVRPISAWRIVVDSLVASARLSRALATALRSVDESE